MTTTKQIIDRAAGKAKIKSEGQDLSEPQYADFLIELNNFMLQEAAEGLQMGWNELTTQEETISTPRWADNYVITHLAMIMMDEFGIPATLYAAAEKARRVVETNLMRLPKTAYPNILPTGRSANGRYGYGYAFFVDDTPGQIRDNKGRPITNEKANPLYNQHNVK